MLSSTYIEGFRENTFRTAGPKLANTSGPYTFGGQWPSPPLAIRANHASTLSSLKGKSDTPFARQPYWVFGSLSLGFLSSKETNGNAASNWDGNYEPSAFAA